MVKRKLIPLHVAIKRFFSVAAAARAWDVDYFTLRRWLNRESVPAQHSNSRALMAEKGIALPS